MLYKGYTAVAGRDLHHDSGEAPEQDRVPESRADMHTTVRSVALPEQALGGERGGKRLGKEPEKKGSAINQSSPGKHVRSKCDSSPKWFPIVI